MDNMVEYAARRIAVMDSLGDGVLILPTMPHGIFSNDVEYKFRPHTNMIYFVGYPEPETTCVVERKEGKTTTTLFVPKRDKLFEIWNGRRFGVEGALKHFKVDEAYENTELAEKLLEMLKNHHSVFYKQNDNEVIDEIVRDAMANAVKSRDKKGTGPINLINPIVAIDTLRSVKSEYEIELIKKSAKLSANAHTKAMKVTKPGIGEYQIEALIDYEFRKNGASGPAYSSICGGGVNATILHYIENSDELRDGELLLVDAGSEYKGYAADITRTWPVNGKFNEAQKKVYQAVLDVENECIEMVKPGILFNEIHEASLRMITKKLIDLGLLEGDVEKLIEEEKHRRFFMHGLGHWLGIDTHDTNGADRKETPLERGNYFTIEPGIYIPDEEDIPDEYRGIGIRIEDDILVTETGYDILSKDVVKEIDEIEAIVGTEMLP